MKTKLLFLGLSICIFTLVFYSHLPSRPSFNGPTPRCSGGGCHTWTSGIFTVAVLPNLVVQVTVNGVTSGGNVAGELVDTLGNVVDVVDLSSSNPFTLTAPQGGTFVVNAGFKQPSRQWDSARVSFPVTGIGGSSSEKPVGEFRLEQNYPNPFNPNTVIEFSLPHSAFTNLKVYNVEGKEVMTLVWQHLPAGRHSIEFKANDLPSGVYFYRLQAAGPVLTRKLLLVK